MIACDVRVCVATSGILWFLCGCIFFSTEIDILQSGDELIYLSIYLDLWFLRPRSNCMQNIAWFEVGVPREMDTPAGKICYVVFLVRRYTPWAGVCTCHCRKK